MAMGSTTHLPVLPPELWLRIFHYATHVPGTLVPDIYDNASLIGPIFIKRYHPALREALVTKRALVRVCKQWWHLAVPILYQSVYIGRTRCLYSLSSTLLRSAEGKGTVVSTRPLGEYTQRLDIAIRDDPKDVGAECGLMEDLIGCMSHLDIFSITATTHYADSNLPYSIIKGLERSADSLGVFDWSSHHLRLPASVINWLLDCTQLRVLNNPFLCLLWNNNLPIVPPTVTTFRSRDISFFLDAPRQYLPSALQEMILDLNEYPDNWKGFFHMYGPQIISLQLQKHSNMSCNIFLPLQIIVPACPNLRRLTITMVDFADMLNHFPVLPHIPINYLGLRFGIAQPCKSSFHALFSFLEHMRSSMPALQVVQLLNKRNVECLLNTHTKVAVHVLRPFMESGAPFRVEDEDGVLLTDRLKALGHP